MAQEAAIGQQMQEIAHAVGAPVLIGARHAGSTPYFAHCDGVEHDGTTFSMALDGLVSLLQKRAATQRNEGHRAVTKADKVLALGGG